MDTKQHKTGKMDHDATRVANSPVPAVQAVTEAEPLIGLADPMVLQRAMTDPQGLPPGTIPGLQRSLGNRHVQAMLGSAAQRQSPSRVAAQIQAQFTEDDEQQQALQQTQEAAEPDNGSLPQVTQRQPDADGTVELSDPMSTEIKHGTSGGGKSLPRNTQAQMKQNLGIANPEKIQVHSDTRADALTRSLGARAFTTGSHIFFGQGEYDPSSAQGQSLLYHESVHTMQQGGTKSRAPQTKMTVTPPDDKYEQEADNLAEEALATAGAGEPQAVEPASSPKAKPSVPKQSREEKDREEEKAQQREEAQDSAAEREEEGEENIQGEGKSAGTGKPAEVKHEAEKGKEKEKGGKEQAPDPKKQKRDGASTTEGEEEKAQQREEAQDSAAEKKEEGEKNTQEEGKTAGTGKPAEAKHEAEKGKEKEKGGKEQAPDPKKQKRDGASTTEGSTGSGGGGDQSGSQVPGGTEQVPEDAFESDLPPLPDYEQYAWEPTKEASLPDWDSEYAQAEQWKSVEKGEFDDLVNQDDNEISVLLPKHDRTKTVGTGEYEGADLDREQMIRDALGQGAVAGLVEGAIAGAMGVAIGLVATACPFIGGAVATAMFAVQGPKGWANQNVLSIGKTAESAWAGFKGALGTNRPWQSIALATEMSLNLNKLLLGALNLVVTVMSMVAFGLWVLSILLSYIPYVGWWLSIPPYLAAEQLLIWSAHLGITIAQLTIAQLILAGLATLARIADLAWTDATPDELLTKQAALKSNMKDFTATGTQLGVQAAGGAVQGKLEGKGYRAGAREAVLPKRSDLRASLGAEPEAQDSPGDQGDTITISDDDWTGTNPLYQGRDADDGWTGTNPLYESPDADDGWTGTNPLYESRDADDGWTGTNPLYEEPEVPVPTRGSEAPTPTQEPETTTPTQEPETTTPTQEPETTTPTQEPETTTPTEEPETTTPTEEPETTTPTEEPEPTTPTEEPEPTTSTEEPEPTSPGDEGTPASPEDLDVWQFKIRGKVVWSINLGKWTRVKMEELGTPYNPAAEAMGTEEKLERAKGMAGIGDRHAAETYYGGFAITDPSQLKDEEEKEKYRQEAFKRYGKEKTKTITVNDMWAKFKEEAKARAATLPERPDTEQQITNNYLALIAIAAERRDLREIQQDAATTLEMGTNQVAAAGQFQQLSGGQQDMISAHQEDLIDKQGAQRRAAKTIAAASQATAKNQAQSQTVSGELRSNRGTMESGLQKAREEGEGTGGADPNQTQNLGAQATQMAAQGVSDADLSAQTNAIWEAETGRAKSESAAIVSELQMLDTEIADAREDAEETVETAETVGEDAKARDDELATQEEELLTRREQAITEGNTWVEEHRNARQRIVADLEAMLREDAGEVE